MVASLLDREGGDVENVTAERPPLPLFSQWHCYTAGSLCYVCCCCCRCVHLAEEFTSTQVLDIVPADDIQWNDELDWWMAGVKSKSVI